MSEMKMSDTWDCPVTYGIYDSVTTGGHKFTGGLYGMLFNSEEPAKAVAHAANNHDRLTEENQKLRELLSVLCGHRCPCEYWTEEEVYAQDEAETLLEQTK